jgi:choline-sulfatase
VAKRDRFGKTFMSKSNVLILCSDEHARSALGCQGHPVVKTPTLDALAARGTRFAKAYTPSPICIPARASLATGLLVHETRCWSSAEPYHGQIESWMHRLRARGHPVTSIGKLHFRSGGDDHGFDEEIEPMYLANDGIGWPQGLLRDPMPAYDEVTQLAAEAGPGESSYTEYDRRVTARARDWLRAAPRTSDRPWALFVSFISPHYPLTAPRAFFDLYEGLEIPEPVGATPAHPVLREMIRFWDYDRHFDVDTRRLARRCYYGLCSFLDHNIRQVLQALEDSGQAGETTVISISDHGEMLGNHGMWTKSVMYEESVGIPLIMTGPGIGIGVNHTPVSLTDIAATVETAVGSVPPPANGDWAGRPLQTFIDEPEPDRAILSEYHDGGSPTGIFMLRAGRWKLVLYAGGHPAQLFDLETDPDELLDLGASPGHGNIRRGMDAALHRILDPESVNAQAFADQSRMVENLGGRERILATPSFGHTPLET